MAAKVLPKRIFFYSPSRPTHTQTHTAQNRACRDALSARILCGARTVPAQLAMRYVPIATLAVRWTAGLRTTCPVLFVSASCYVWSMRQVKNISMHCALVGKCNMYYSTGTSTMEQKERNENFSIPSLLSCGVALKSGVLTGRCCARRSIQI